MRSPGEPRHEKQGQRQERSREGSGGARNRRRGTGDGSRSRTQFLTRPTAEQAAKTGRQRHHADNFRQEILGSCWTMRANARLTSDAFGHVLFLLHYCAKLPCLPSEFTSSAAGSPSVVAKLQRGFIAQCQCQASQLACRLQLQPFGW